MSHSIETDAALAKLARTLEVDPSAVEFLSGVPVDELRELRFGIDDELSVADAKRLQGVMAASNLVPIGVAATIGEKWFGPVLCARLVGLVDPKRGGQYARHLSVDFMAEITARTDPRVVGDLVYELDLKAMQKIALTLLQRGDYLTLSHFVPHLPPEVVVSILDAIDDNATVVRIARYVDDLSALDPVVALLPDERIVQLVEAVVDADLWVEGLHLFRHLGVEQITRVARTIATQDLSRFSESLAAFERHGLWAEAMQVVDHLDAADIEMLAPLLDDVDPAIVAQLPADFVGRFATV